jgi:hypothetical protein
MLPNLSKGIKIGPRANKAKKKYPVQLLHKSKIQKVINNIPKCLKKRDNMDYC